MNADERRQEETDADDARPRATGPALLPALALACVMVNLVGTLAAGNNANSPTVRLVLVVGLYCALEAEWLCLVLWGVFAPSPWYVRWPRALLVALLAVVVLMVGSLLTPGRGWLDWRPLLAVPCSVPALYLASQLPFWIMRLVWGFRLVTAGDDTKRLRDERPFQFTIADMLGATTIFAVALGFGRAAFVLASDQRDFARTLGTVAPLYVFGSLLLGLLFGLPAVFAAWIGRRKRLGVYLAMIYSQTLAVVVFSVLVMIFGGPSDSAVVKLLTMCFASGALMLMLLGALHFIRVCGYELRRPGQPGIEPPAGSREKEPQMNTDERREE